MEKYIEYVNKFHESNQNEIDFINNQLKKHLDNNQENQTDIEHILDFLYSTKKSYKNIGYKTILEKANAWNKKLIESASSKDNEVEGVDYEVVKDFGDGFRFVKLISEIAYQREGKLMSHCVSSYYGRNVNIYSLRDSKNLPHCTIESDSQVKGKGNQTVDNKYFGYCIKFLEETGMSIGENEMKNIGFYKLDSIDKDLSIDEKYLYDGKYISEKNIDKIKDKEGNTYYGFGLLNIKELVIFNDMKFSISLDTEKVVKYIIKGCKIVSDLIIGSSGYSAQIGSSGDYAKIGSSGDYAKIKSEGLNSVISAIGEESSISGKIGIWIVLAEYNEEGICTCVKTAKIDGKILKEDTFYTLKDGEFQVKV